MSWGSEISTFSFILIIIVLESVNCQQKCSDILLNPASCSCGSFDENQKNVEIHCPDITHSSVQINYEQGMLLKIQCTGNIDLENFNSSSSKVTSLDFLENFHFKYVNQLKLLDCPIDDELKFWHLLNTTQPKSVELKATPFYQRQIPYSLSVMNQLVDLEFSESDLRGLGQFTAENLDKLEKISLADNNLTQINSELSRSRLRVLNLSNNKIEKISTNAFKGLSSLMVLDLYSNRLEDLNPVWFKDLENLKSLELMNNNLKVLPANVFVNLSQLVFINLENNYLEQLPHDLFSVHQNLQSIRLSRNKQLRQFPRGFLANCDGLETFKVEDCALESLDEDLFRNTSKIRQIYLGSNQIKVLHLNLFRGLVHLEELNLQKNSIFHLPDGLFKDLVQLKLLNLKENQVRELTDLTFMNLKSLQKLFMSNNQLDYISEYALQETRNLSEINLSKNKLQKLPSGFCKDKMLRIVDLSNNQLDDTDNNNIQLNSCFDLEHLDMSHNKIEDFSNDFLLNKISMKNLNLAHNNIQGISFIDFQTVSQHKVTLNLSHNLIKNIGNLDIVKALIRENQKYLKPHDTLEQLIVDVSNNPFECDCNLYDLVRYFYKESQMRSVIDLKTSNLICSGPKEYKGQSILDLSIEKLMCPIENCSKSPECVCHERPYLKGLLVNCNGKGLRQVPDLMWDQGLTYYDPDLLQIEINLEGNSLREFSKPKIDIAESLWNYKIHYLNLADNDLSSFDWVPNGLEKLNLLNNNLTYLSEGILEQINIEAVLHQNPWTCDCNTIPFWRFLGDSPLVQFKDDIKCFSTQKPIRLMDQDELCPTHLGFIIVMIVLGALLITIPSIIAALFYKYNHEIKVWLFAHNLCLWFVQEEDLDKDKTYDAFLSFSHVDEGFVIEHLLPKLEQGPTPYKLCIHLRNWVPGEFITTQIADSVANSRRTIVVLSPSFLDSVWGKMEFRTAYTTALKEGVARVIVILYGDVDPADPSLDKELQVYLRTNTYIKWGDPWFWDKLKYALPHNKLKRGVNYANGRDLPLYNCNGKGNVILK